MPSCQRPTSHSLSLCLCSAGVPQLHKDIISSWKQAGPLDRWHPHIYLLAVHGDECAYEGVGWPPRWRPGKRWQGACWWRRRGPACWVIATQFIIIPSQELEVKAAQNRGWRRGEQRLGCERETVDHMWYIRGRALMKKDPEQFFLSLWKNDSLPPSKALYYSLGWSPSSLLAMGM